MYIGIVGSGKIVTECLGFIQQIKGIHIEAIIGRMQSKEKVTQIAFENNISKVYFDYNEALEDSKIDFMYIALPNHLHYDYVKRALLKGKNVICEKPFTQTYQQAKELAALALEKHLYLFEAITNQYLPNYLKIKASLKALGPVKIVSCNYSQYSSRYDNFKKGIIHPAFDASCAGGALYDLNVYNLYFVIGLFGKPDKVQYFPNIQRNIDTSGIAVLSYPTFQCVCIGSKDCNSPIGVTIQGEEGYLLVEGPSSVCKHFEMVTSSGKRDYVQSNQHRMYYEFVCFQEIYESKHFDTMAIHLNKSLEVMSVIDSIKVIHD